MFVSYHRSGGPRPRSDELVEIDDTGAARARRVVAIGRTGSFAFQLDAAALASLRKAVSGAANTPVEAALYGREGTIYLHPRWHHTQRITVSKYEGKGQTKRDLEMPYEGWGYGLEAAHVMQCLDNEILESDQAPLNLTLDLMETLDNIREKVGLVY